MFLKIIVMLIPIAMIILYPIYMRLSKGDYRNNISGIRTLKSMESKENRMKVHRKAAKLYLIFGIILTLISLFLINFTKLSEFMVTLTVIIELIIYIMISYISIYSANKKGD